LGRRREGQGQVRIIAGEWRGRRLSVATREGLRPTGDRVRETLFNWLAPHVPGARCLDLFAGSGALGIEALSRGAAHCLFVDNDAAVATTLRGELDLLGAGKRATLRRAPAHAVLAGQGGPVDLVFIDPPFDADLVGDTCAALDGSGWLAPGALVYVEHAARQAPRIPGRWGEPLRRKHSGDVAYALYAATDPGTHS
jgi:16S rRNA (guanine966-N2)-methyltransferase